jgi:hypothetical protein
MLRTLLFCGAWFSSLLILWSALLQQPPFDAGESSPALAAKVKRLLQQLDSTDPKQQVAAESALLHLGPQALPFLPRTDPKSASPQAQRLLAIRRVLQELLPRTVSLQCDGASLKEVLAQLAKQTGMTVVDRRVSRTETKVDLRLDGATFWQAVDAICRKANANLSLFQPDGNLALVDGPYRELPNQFRGPIHGAVKRIALTRDLETGNHSCDVQLEFAWEPRFRPFLAAIGTCTVTFQPDGKGHAKVVRQDSKGQVPVQGRSAVEFDVRVAAPARSCPGVARLEGELSVITACKMLTFAFDQLAVSAKPGKERRQVKEDVGVTLSRLQVDEENWTVDVFLDYPPGGPHFESYQSWLSNNQIYLERLKGDKVRIRPSGEEDLRPANAPQPGVRYRFSNRKGLGQPRDWRLVYETPGRIVELKVPFVFTNLELP